MNVKNERTCVSCNVRIQKRKKKQIKLVINDVDPQWKTSQAPVSYGKFFEVKKIYNR